MQEWHRSTTHARRIPVKVDPEDLGRVSARLGDEWVHLECVSPGFAGKPLRVWRDACADLRARFAAGAKLSEPILLDALRAAQEAARLGATVFGLTEAWSTAEQIDRTERGLDMGWVMPGMEAAPPLLDGAVPATGPETAQAGPATSTVVSIEDDGSLDVPEGAAVDDMPAVPDLPDAADDTPQGPTDGKAPKAPKARKALKTKKADRAPEPARPSAEVAGPNAIDIE